MPFHMVMQCKDSFSKHTDLKGKNFFCVQKKLYSLDVINTVLVQLYIEPGNEFNVLFVKSLLALSL